MIIFDTSQEYRCILAELDLWYAGLAPGGLLVLHDVSEFVVGFDVTGEGGVRRFFFSSRRRHTRSVSAFLLNRSSDLNANNSAALTGRSTPLIMFSVNSAPSMMRQAV